MVKVFPFRFQQCLVPLSMLLVEGSSKRGLFRDLTTFFGARNFGNTEAMRLIFFLRMFKF